MVSEQPWSVRVSIHEVSETGRSITIAADEATRAAVAKLAGVSALPRLDAQFDLSFRGRDGLHVTGRVMATVGQTCIVTLEPIENEVVEDIDVVFMPAVAPVIIDEDGMRVEVTTVDAPEPLVGGFIDLGAIATEFLILGIDPYPRRPDAMFEAPAAKDETSHPFAALAALKKRDDGTDA